jgi:hypothetical protein
MAGSWGQALITNGAASSALFDCPGGICVFAAAGTFGGCTVNLQLLAPDGSTLLTAGTATTLTAAGMGVAYLPPGQIQATVTGGAPSGLYVSIARVVG